MASMDEDTEMKEMQSMYVFEGTDYSKEPSTDDIEFFDKMIESKKCVIYVCIVVCVP